MISKVIACAALFASGVLLVSPWVAPKVWAEVSNVLVSAVLNAMKPAIVRIVAEAVKQATHIEREACIGEIAALRHAAPEDFARGAYSMAIEAIRARGEAP